MGEGAEHGEACEGAGDGGAHHAGHAAFRTCGSNCVPCSASLLQVPCRPLLTVGCPHAGWGATVGEDAEHGEACEGAGDGGVHHAGHAAFRTCGSNCVPCSASFSQAPCRPLLTVGCPHAGCGETVGESA